MELIERSVQNSITLDRRLDSVKEAQKKGAELIVMDDGFQDWSIKKDLSIICFDSNEGVGNEKVLPAGPLREPLEKINKAQIVVIKGGENKKLEELIAGSRIEVRNGTDTKAITIDNWESLKEFRKVVHEPISGSNVNDN